MRFSIIIPVYNVEEYIGKCLASVAAQTYPDFEAIIVDDETPDNSMAIVAQYVERYPDKFRVIHQKNKGLGGARNTGVQAAQGEYLLFLDSDDYIDASMLDILNQRITENPCDMLLFNYQEVTSDGTALPSPTACPADIPVCTEEEKARMMLSPPAAWNKLYRKDFYLACDVSFPEKLLYEDAITRILLAKAKVVQLCTARLYYYVQRSTSIMHSTVSNRCLEIMQVVDSVYDRFVKDGLYETYQNTIDASLMLSILAVVNSIHSRDWTHPAQKTLVDYLAGRFPDYQNNPFIAKNHCVQIALLRDEKYKENRLREKRSQLKTNMLTFPVIFFLNGIRKKLIGAVRKTKNSI